MKKYLFLSILFPFFFKAQVSPHFFNIMKCSGSNVVWSPSCQARLASGNKIIGGYENTGSFISGGLLSSVDQSGNILWQKTYDLGYYPTSASENGTSTYALMPLLSHNGPTGIIKVNSLTGNTLWFKHINATNPQYNGTAATLGRIFKENLNTAFTFLMRDVNTNTWYTLLTKCDVNGNIVSSKRLDTLSVYGTAKAGSDYILVGNDGTSNVNEHYVLSVSSTYAINWCKKLTFPQQAYGANTIVENNVIYLPFSGVASAGVIALDFSGNTLWSRTYYSSSPGINSVSCSDMFYKSGKLHMFSGYSDASGGYYSCVTALSPNGGTVYKNRVLHFNANSTYAGNRVVMNADSSVYEIGQVDMGGSLQEMFQSQFDVDGDLEMCVADSITILDSAFTVASSNYNGFSFSNDPVSMANYTATPMPETMIKESFKITIDSIVPTQSTCSQLCAGIESAYISGADPSPVVQWSANTGSQTTYAAYNLCPGTYSVTATDVLGCSASGSATLSTALPQTPDICMVTVDSIGTTNYIFWDKSAYSPTDTFIVYRDTANNNYARIGKVPFDSLSQFADTVRSLYAANGDPTVSSWRYKIAVRDSCGNFSAQSPYHQTMFFQNSSGNFSWNHYQIEGQIIPVPTLSNYRFKRDDISTGVWNTIQLLSASSIAYTDPSYGTFSSTASWRVETQWSTTCTPTLKLTPEAMAAVAKSRSNVQNNFAVTGIKTITEKDFILMPNPANDFIVIQSKTTMKNVVVEVYDLTGRLVLPSSIIPLLSAGAFSAKEGFHYSININTSNLSAGIYSVRIISDNGKAVKKLVIEK